MGQMRVLDSSGDRQVKWELEDKASIEAAEEVYKTLKNAGFTFFTVEPGTDKGSKLKDFDSAQETIVAIPRVTGG